MLFMAAAGPLPTFRANASLPFRPQVHGAMFGTTSTDFLGAYSKEKLGIDPSKLKVAIIHEDGPYGSGVAAGNEAGAKAQGFDIDAEA